MLEKIRDSINKLPDVSFEDYFNAYIIEMQDIAIDYEFKELSKQNTLDLKYISSVEQSISNTHEGLVK